MTLETINNLMWLVVIASLCGNICVIKKKVLGFYLWSITNLLWAIYNIYINAIAQAVLMLVCLIFCIYGIIEWKKKGKCKCLEN